MRFAINPKSLSAILLLVSMTICKAQDNDIKLTLDGSQNAQRQNMTDTDRSMLKSLVYDKVESAYLLSNADKKPVMLSTERIITDVASLPALSKTNSKTVQVIVVKILDKSELMQDIDFSVFANFPNLQCVYISCEVKASQQQIIRMIKKDKEVRGLVTYLGFNVPI